MKTNIYQGSRHCQEDNAFNRLLTDKCRDGLWVTEFEMASISFVDIQTEMIILLAQIKRDQVTNQSEQEKCAHVLYVKKNWEKLQ